MADPTTVNDQITDSVTQANVKVIGEAPAMALASLYQSTAQALGMAAQNAVYAQQQMAVTLQAATAMGASHIYSLASTEAPQSLAASLANANTSLAEQANANHINQQVEDAIKDTLNSVLGSAGDVSYAMRAVMDSFAAALQRVSINQYRSALDIIKIAAVASTLAAMINKPENAAGYQQILEIIERL